MGNMSAVAIAESLDVDLVDQIKMHLQFNHYPPVPATMVNPCIEAIDAGWEEDWNREITLPEDVKYKGKFTAPAWAIAEQHHLDAWLAEEDGR